MNIWLLPLIALIASSGENLACTDGQIRAVVERLGYKVGDEAYNFTKDFEILSRQPAEAACQLIRELQVLRAVKITPVDEEKQKTAMHVIWCIRALRYLTGGLDFTGRTRYRFKESERERKHFLTIKSETELPFFSVWMSRDIIYIAPPDVQKEIINKWIQWYGEQGKDFPYKASENIDQWYF